MLPVVLCVADVVDEVGRARRGAVRPEGQRAPRATASTSPSFAAKISPAKSSRFFDHCRGRSAANAARAHASAALCRRRQPRPDRSCLRRQRGGQHQVEAAARAQARSSSSIRPPSATASSRAIASPRPVPPPSRDQNGRKIRSCSVVLDPRARCPDRDRDGSVLCASASETRPPSGVQRKAFERRLETIWKTRSPSETITGCACASQR